MAASNTNDRFTLQLPDEWEDRTVHCFLGTEDSGVPHALSLVVDRNVNTDDLAEYARDRIDQIVESMPAAEILKEAEKTLADGVPAYEVIFKWVPASGAVTFQKLVYVIRDGIAYSFSADFSKKTIKTIGVEFDQIVESFEPMTS